jgi:hypothetical protein
MTLTPGHRNAGSPQDDLANRPTIVLPGQRGRRGMRRPAIRRAPLIVVAVANTAWAAVFSLLPVLLTVIAVTRIGSASPDVPATIRFGLATWLLAHGVPLVIGGTPLSLVPLAISGVAFWRLGVAGWRTVRATGSPIGLVTVVNGTIYGLFGLSAAVLADGAAVSVPILRATLTLAVFAAVAALVGASAGDGLARRWWRRAPKIIRLGVRVGAIAVLLELAIGAIGSGIAIAVGGGDAAQMVHDYHAGFAGQAGIVAICLVYAPNVSVWASSYLAGPSFTLGAVPALPIFAGLPPHGLSGAAQMLLLTPVLAGFVAGLWMARRLRTGWSLPRLVMIGLMAGPVAAAGLILAGTAAAGAVGSKLLAHTGEVGWQFPVVCGIGIGVGAVLGTLTNGLIRRPPASP